MKNKIWQPVIILGSIILILIVISSFDLPIVPFLNHYTKIDILADIRKDDGEDKQDDIAETQEKIKTTKAFLNNGDITQIKDYSDSLKYFFAKLDSIKSTKRKVRIAYFGDSFIESDYVTDEIRKRLQEIYGGSGVGFVPVQSVVADDYLSIHFYENKTWTDYNYQNNPNKYNLGLMGHVFFPNGNGIAQYSTFTSSNETFKSIKLYTGNTKVPTHVRTVYDDKDEEIVPNNSSDVNETLINTASPVNNFKMECDFSDLPVYGLSFEDSEGIYVDNYGFRGNTGLLTLQISPTTMQNFNHYFNYDLIILHYGLNAIDDDDPNTVWFENGMNKLIKNIHEGFPNVPVLLISTSDLAIRKNGKYITDPLVPKLVERQRKLAEKNKVAFWDLYDAMGGKGTIANWVEGDTTFAYKDYMHVNPKGAKKVGDIFVDRFLTAKKILVK